MILDLFRNEVELKNIQGYDDIKDIVKRALDAEDNYRSVNPLNGIVIIIATANNLKLQLLVMI